MAASTNRQGWAELLPARVANTPLRGKFRTSWTVIGAGFTGLAAARRLAELDPNDSIIVLDAGELAQNASGRNSGFVVATSDFSGRFNPAKLHEYQRINRINQTGLDLLRDLVRRYKIDCQWRESGFYRTGADKRAVRKADEFSTYLEALGVPHRLLAREQTATELGTDHYRHAIHVDGGALVQPAALCFGLAAHLPTNVTLFENSPLLHIRPRTAGSFILELPQGRIDTTHVLVATNFQMPNLGIKRGRLVGSTLSGSLTRPLRDEEMSTLGSATSWGVLSLHGGGATVRLTEDRRILIRNTAEYHGARLLDATRLAQRQQIHRAAFDTRFPQLAHVPFETSWSCVEGISWNGTCLFGRTAAGVYYAGGYNGSGISRGTAMGTALADWAAGNNSPLIRDCRGFAPARLLPPRPLLDIGAWFTMRNRFRGVGRDR